MEHQIQGWQILVVDDDPKSLKLMRVLLGSFGLVVHVAENGQQALRVLEVLEPKFIITDLSMPIMDGWQLIKRLKSEQRWASIPIIALTAHAMPGDREKAIAVGCHNYLTKPLTPQTFKEQLMAVLSEIPDLGLVP